MTPPISRLLVAVLAMTGLAQAQLAGSLQLSKNQYLSGEAIIAVVSITNAAGVDMTANYNVTLVPAGTGVITAAIRPP